MLKRLAFPTSPIMEPSRAKMIEDCGGMMICQASTDWLWRVAGRASRVIRAIRDLCIEWILHAGNGGVLMEPLVDVGRLPSDVSSAGLCGGRHYLRSLRPSSLYRYEPATDP